MSHEYDVIEAVQNADADTLNELLAANPGLAAARLDSGVSALMLALYQRDATLIDPIVRARDGFDVFESAALGDMDRLDYHMEHDREAATHVSPDGFSPLHLAAFFDRPDVVRFLLERGGDPDQVTRNPMNLQPLHSAVAGGSLESVRLLVDHGADPDAVQEGGWTPLMGAAGGGHEAIVELLIDAGADPNTENDQGLTAIDLAEEKNHESVADFLASVS